MTATRQPTALHFRQDTLNEAYKSLFRGTPREAAVRAVKTGGPPVEELEQRIIAFRLEHTKKKADPTPMRTDLHHKNSLATRSIPNDPAT